MAGPPLLFDEPMALAAAALTQQACWFLVSHAEPPPELERRLVMPAPPRSPAEHLSADLTLRLLPQVHRRACSRDPADPLVVCLADVLRRWPLSGVLSASSDAWGRLSAVGPQIARQIAPAINTYIAAAGLLLTALGMWWWAERIPNH